MLTVENLSYFRNEKKIFAQLGFSVGTGSVLVIKGENGCGKSTLLKILAGIIKPSVGKVLWGGADVSDFYDDFSGDLQFIGHKNFLKQNLTIRQNLSFYTKLADSEMALAAALSFFKLTEFADQQVKRFSAGWQKKIMLAKLLACPATIWLLDEPSSSLDQASKERLHGLIKSRAKENGLVILTTHDEMFYDLGPNLDLRDWGEFTFA